MKWFRKAMCLILPACMLASLSACSRSPKMGEPLAAPVNQSVPEQRERAEKQGDIFV